MISIVVPVYNVEKYIEECLLSILNQTYVDFELILVDDGSSDASGLLCDKYKMLDARVQVIHKLNGGLSEARNVGTKIAKGQYVTFIDGDDIVSSNYLSTLVELIQKYKAEMAVTGIKKFYDGNVPVEEKRNCVSNCYSGEEALINVLYQNYMDTSACALLIPLKVAQSNEFPIGKYHEDDYTTYKYYLSVNKIGVSKTKQYFYRRRRGSITSSFGQAIYDELDAADNLVEKIGCINCKLKKAAESKKYSNYCQVILSTKNLETLAPETYERIKDYLLSQKWKIITDANVRIRNKMAAISTLFGIKGLFILDNLIKACRGIPKYND